MTLGEYLPNSNTKLLLHLNGNSTDSSGNGNNGTDTAITYSQANGKFGQGAGFNGTTSQISRTDYLGFNINGNNNITVSLWFNYASLSSGGSYSLFEIDLDPPSGTRYFYRVWFENASGIYRFSLAGRGLINVTQPAVNTWHNLVFTTDTSQNNKLYLNGALIYSNTANDSSSATNVPRTVIGNNNSEKFVGNIDEIIVESIAWTPEQVKKYYTFTQARFGII